MILRALCLLLMRSLGFGFLLKCIYSQGELSEVSREFLRECLR